MTEVYEKNGLYFAYPDNWTIEDDDPGNADASATAFSPDTAFWSVLLYQEAQDLRELADCVLAALRDEYPQIEVEETAPQLEGEGCGYHLSFSYVDLLSTATIRTFCLGDRTLVVLCQAEDHELPVAEQVFQAMTHSLLQVDRPE